MTVLPGPDGTCPSCRGGVNGAGGIDSKMRGVVLRELERVPEVCARCGGTAGDGQVVVDAGRRGNVVSASFWAIIAGVMLSPLRGWKLYREMVEEPGPSLHIKVPLLAADCGL